VRYNDPNIFYKLNTKYLKKSFKIAAGTPPMRIPGIAKGKVWIKIAVTKFSLLNSSSKLKNFFQ
jgi:hypothetical protein